MCSAQSVHLNRSHDFRWQIELVIYWNDYFNHRDAQMHHFQITHVNINIIQKENANRCENPNATHSIIAIQIKLKVIKINQWVCHSASALTCRLFRFVGGAHSELLFLMLLIVNSNHFCCSWCRRGGSFCSSITCLLIYLARGARKLDFSRQSKW